MSFLDEARTGELWAKVKAALSGKQSKLTGTAGQVVGFGADGAAVAVQGWSNPNLLDNCYFPDPINHRGKMEYNGRGYTIDRWYNQETTKKVILQNGSIQISGPGTQLFFQIIEHPAAPGETLTMSVLTDDGVFSSVTAEMIGNGNHSHQVPIGSTSWFLDCWEVDGQLWPRIYKVNEADTVH